MKIFAVVLFAAGAVSLLRAVETKTWEQGDMSDFEKGTLTGLSLSNEGRLTVAPAVREVFDGSVAFMWAVARDSKGNIYAAGGGLGGTKAKLFVDSLGKVRTLAELDGIAIQALAIDGTDRVYAATSPDGKVYRVDASGKAEVFYDPKAKYIWAMAFDRSGNLYVATGDQGEIHRVTASGVGSVFFRTEETHARSLAVDGNGNLIVGTDPSGLVLRVSPAGQGFVLYQAPKREITTVALGADGSIYAGGIGNKGSGGGAQNPPPPPAAQGSGPRGAALPNSAAAPAVAGGSELYRIQADGYARKVWSHPQDLIYALTFDSKGKPIAGTGNNGALYRIDSEHSYTRLASVASTQVTGLSSAPDGTVYAVTGNIGKLFSIGPGPEASGTFESDVLDASAFTYWGRITTEPETLQGALFETRSGNLNRTQQNWSSWEKLNAGRIASPAARFLQYRVTLSGPAELAAVRIAYQMKNIAPVIEEVEITPANFRLSASTAAAPAATLAPFGQKPPAARPANLNPEIRLTPSKGQLGVRWLPYDENGDSMLFKLEIRGVNESSWKLLKDKVRETYTNWDSAPFPDGKYVLRITATDEASNPPDLALTSSRETDPFIIDNTPPEITGLNAAPSAGKIEVQFHARDALSTLAKAEYSVNGGEWIVVEPTTRLTDSTEHDYRVRIDRVSGEMTIATRVSDEYENQAVAKTIVK